MKTVFSAGFRDFHLTKKWTNTAREHKCSFAVRKKEKQRVDVFQQGLWKVSGRASKQKAEPQRAGCALTGEGAAGASQNIFA